MDDFRRQLRLVLADRHSAEAAALYRTCFEYAARRVALLGRTRCRGLLEVEDHDEIVAEVVTELMAGALARFQGGTVGELMAFVRTMTDRTAVRRAQRHLRQRDTIARVLEGGEAPWDPVDLGAPSDVVEDVPSPLDRSDQTYLVELLRAGSKAELARRAGVSRAAVSQRVARIEARLAQLSAGDRDAHAAWMRRAAGLALAEQHPPPDEDSPVR